MGFDDEVDFDVKAPLLASTFAIAGIPDIEGENLPSSGPEVSESELEQFEAGLVHEEDQRNQASGSRFHRIFPTEEMDDLEGLLVIPPYSPHAAQRQRQQKILNPKKLGSLLTPEQSDELLIAFLGKLVADAKENGNVLAAEKAGTFLAAQGYQVTNTRSLGIALRKFTERRRALMGGADREVPEVVSRIIETAKDSLIAQLLTNSSVSGLSQLRFLFA
jgi:hypothetical protein